LLLLRPYRGIFTDRAMVADPRSRSSIRQVMRPNGLAGRASSNRRRHAGEARRTWHWAGGFL